MPTKKWFLWALLVFEISLVSSYYFYVSFGMNPCAPAGFGSTALIWKAVCSENFEPTDNAEAYIVFLMMFAAVLIAYLFIKIKKEK